MADEHSPNQSQDQQQDASHLVQNLLSSLGTGGKMGASQQQGLRDMPYTTLSDLLPPSSTIPYVASASPGEIDHLCAYLPQELFVLALEAESCDSDGSAAMSSSQDAEALIQRLPINKKREICSRVLRSPQFQQSLASLTTALRDGGLPSISESLGFRDEEQDAASLSRYYGGAAVEAFVKMIKKTAEAEGKRSEKK